MRLFIALDFAHAVKNEIFTECTRALGSFPLRLKCVEEENLHITLAFLGETDQKTAALLKEKLAAFAFHRQEIIFSDKIGFFFKKLSPFPLVLDVIEGNNYLCDLQAALSRHLSLDHESHFHPHLTLARVKEGCASKNEIPALYLTCAIAAEPLAITLFASELTPKGPRYTSLLSTTLN